MTVAEYEQKRLDHLCEIADRIASTFGRRASTKRSVVGPGGTIFPSARAAAVLLGRSEGTIARWCRDHEYGWRYKQRG